MRLKEFSDEDQSAYKMSDKENRTLAMRMADLEQSYASVTTLVSNYISNKQGNKEKIKIILDNLNNDAVNFYEFCNECNDDSETREYLDRLKLIYNAVNDMGTAIG